MNFVQIPISEIRHRSEGSGSSSDERDHREKFRIWIFRQNQSSSNRLSVHLARGRDSRTFGGTTLTG
jgi:hypothetical protein